MLDVSSRFELEGGAHDIEVTGQALLQGVEQLGGVAVAEAARFDEDVRAQHRQAGGDGGCVQVMHVENVRYRGDVRADLGQVDMARGRLEQDVNGDQGKSEPGDIGEHVRGVAQ